LFRFTGGKNDAQTNAKTTPIQFIVMTLGNESNNSCENTKNIYDIIRNSYAYIRIYRQVINSFFKRDRLYGYYCFIRNGVDQRWA